MPAEAVERTLAAIFAADIAGYSRLMGRDEAGTLARLKSCRAVIDRLISAVLEELDKLEELGMPFGHHRFSLAQVFADAKWLHPCACLRALRPKKKCGAAARLG